MPICGHVALQFSLLHEHGFSLSCKKFFPAAKYFFFLATLNCFAAVAALNHIRLRIWHFEVSCSKLYAGFKQDSYDLAYTRHMHDELSYW